MPIAVLGAGMQGTCIALELTRRGFDVDLLDQDLEPLNRASLRNEGKIHLGFVYARDATLRTARLMIEGALAYRRLLSEWTAGALDHPVLSEPFTYLVPEDSALPPAKLATHYAAVERLYEDGARAGGDYLGLAPDRLWRPLDRGDADVTMTSKLVTFVCSLNESRKAAKRRSSPQYGQSTEISGCAEGFPMLRPLLARRETGPKSSTRAELSLHAVSASAKPWTAAGWSAWLARSRKGMTFGDGVSSVQ